MSDNDELDKRLASIDENAPFFAHFGRFITAFASMEGQFHAFFRRICGLDEATARAIMGGEPLSKITSVCNRVVQASQWDASRKAAFQQAIDQVNAISDLRHTLVHRGVHRIKNIITSSNQLTAKSKETIEILRLNLSDIKGATTDLVRIIFEIYVIETPQLPQHIHPDIREAIDRPWQYKRIAPDRPHQPRRKGSQ